ncbi:MAG: hypothetical protein RBR40_01825, partial [Tenuifilaceae bacterium]|nr:hypothetical protein [Tenuifilaceae bacterium]
GWVNERLFYLSFIDLHFTKNARNNKLSTQNHYITYNSVFLSALIGRNTVIIQRTRGVASGCNKLGFQPE